MFPNQFQTIMKWKKILWYNIPTVWIIEIFEQFMDNGKIKFPYCVMYTEVVSDFIFSCV